MEEASWLSFEQQAAARGFSPVCGIDEAGRGPLAAPVYAAAVILPEHFSLPGLDDSKKLSAKKREQLYDEICGQAAAWCVASACEAEIDELNILQATFLAMRRACEGLAVPAAYALVDGNRMPPLAIPGETIVKGDARSASIAAASILAKVSRDRYMEEMDALYPQYQFAKHKGYGTKLHVELLRQYGPCPIHRRSFLKKLLPPEMLSDGR